MSSFNVTDQDVKQSETVRLKLYTAWYRIGRTNYMVQSPMPADGNTGKLAAVGEV
jgi:hypothetical protein